MKAAERFCTKYGLAINVASSLLTAAATAAFGDIVSAGVVPIVEEAHGAASSALKKGDFFHQYCSTIGPLVAAGAAGNNSVDRAKVGSQAEMEISCAEFGKFLKTIGFDAEKLPMVPVTDSSGKWCWVANEFAGDFAQRVTAGSNEARGNDDDDAKGAPSEVRPKEGVPRNDDSNGLQAAIDESTVRESAGGSDEVKKDDDNKAKETPARGIKAIRLLSAMRRKLLQVAPRRR